MTKFGKLLLLVIVIAGVTLAIFLTREKISPPLTPDGPEIFPSRVLGNKEDIVSFSIAPGQKVGGILPFQGVLQGGYFFEANILVNILNGDRNLLKAGNAEATADWMTAGPVSFAGSLDFRELPPGPAYIEIHNDNASGLPENDKSILIPVTIME